MLGFKGYCFFCLFFFRQDLAMWPWLAGRVGQAGLELMEILPPMPLDCWNYGDVLSHSLNSNPSPHPNRCYVTQAGLKFTMLLRVTLNS